MKRKILNLAIFQVGWFTCVTSAAAGMAWLGPVAVAAVLGIHLGFIERSRSEAFFLVSGGVIGTLMDSILMWTGAVVFEGPALLGLFCPLWITALWLAFSTTLNVSLGWLRGRYLVASVLGLLAGPTTYYGAMKLGAVTLPNLGFGLVMVAFEYALAMPLLILISEVVFRRARSPRSDPSVETDRQSGVLVEAETGGTPG